MKQHIAVEQLEELDRMQKYKLFDILYYGDPPINPSEKLNIGKMIEILGDSFQSYRCEDGKWQVTKKLFPINDCSSIYYVECYDGKELVDALWQAVKEVIK